MEGVRVLDIENINVAGDKMNGEKLGKGSMVGIERRKTVADNSNLPEQRKTLADISNLSQRNQDRKSVFVNKEYVEKLQRDIMTLTKHVADRNKVIEVSAFELQKLRINYQQLQQQNLQLAQANSQMLAEINAGKDKLKAYQHELGCKNGLLNARNFELKEKAKKVRCQNKRNEAETIKGDEAAQFSQPEEENKPCNTKRKRQSKVLQSKVQSLDPSAVKPGHTKENVEKKSVCLRRQSARFKSGAEETTEIDGKRQSARFKSREEEPTGKDVDAKSVCFRRQSTRFKSGEEEPTEIDTKRQSARFICGEEEPTEKDVDAKSVCFRRQSSWFKSLEEEPTEKNADTKRICSRRQSTRIKCEEQLQKPTEDFFPTHDAKFHVPLIHDDPVHDSCPTSAAPSVKIESDTGKNVPRFETQELRRASYRPTRQAAERVQSYKEIPLNVKMRRE